MFCQHHISCLLWKYNLEESFRKSDPTLAGFKRNYSTPCIHGIQRGQMVMWRVVINLPPPRNTPPPQGWRQEKDRHPRMCSKLVSDCNRVGEHHIIPHNNKCVSYPFTSLRVDYGGHPRKKLASVL